MPQGDTVYATVTPELEEAELEKNVQPMVLEYFEHGDTSEVMVSPRGPPWGGGGSPGRAVPVLTAGPCAQALLQGLNLGERRGAVPALAVVLALEGKASHRELTSRLLADLVGRVLTPDDLAAAFDRMLRDLPDLILDTPEAPQVSGEPGLGTGTGVPGRGQAPPSHPCPHRCWASSSHGPWPTMRCPSTSWSTTRAAWTASTPGTCARVCPHVPSPAPSARPPAHPCPPRRAALDRAAVLLRIKRDVNHLDNVWGVGGGQRPVKHLIKEVRRVPGVGGGGPRGLVCPSVPQRLVRPPR